MLQNAYNLVDLLDLALKVPEVGAVNFNILHTILLTMIHELRLHNIRPWVNIENPVLAKSALTKAKLERKDSKIFEDKTNRGMIPVEEPPKPEKIEEAPPPSKKPSETKKESEEKITEEIGEENVEPEPATIDGADSEPLEKPEDKESEKDVGKESKTDIEEEPEADIEEEPETDIGEESETDSEEGEEEEESETDSEEEESEEDKKEPSPEEKKETSPQNRRKGAGWDDLAREIKKQRKSLVAEEKTPKMHEVRDAWRYTHLDTRLTATEEGMMRVMLIYLL
ncbi:uncharacterized protein TNCT_554581 [Trichonephila clavata]|uniref:Uncharacterized protein n=1 Tax=Trichonephila clavata TaxID=2740835 RepID=A0A8X6IZJ5_TRICU|nr:uncharacterized protein TNCT_554581 [Trichonephila clavata]